MATIDQPILSSEQIAEITAYINAYRHTNQAPPLTWDATIANFAQNWSHYLLSNDVFQHSGTTQYGENLAQFQGYGTDVMVQLKKAVDLWYAESASYNYNDPTYSSAVGHFTCLVWVSSTSFGMGFSINTLTDTVDIVMNTSPPGNVIGQFAQNVLPAINPPPVAAPEPIPAPLPMPTHTYTPPPEIVLPKNDIIVALSSIIQAIQSKRTKYEIVNSIYKVIVSIKNANLIV
jgi:hypothetical protein